MPSLRELQSGVNARPPRREPDGALPLIAARGIAPKHRLDVYANMPRQFHRELDFQLPGGTALGRRGIFSPVRARFHTPPSSLSGDLQSAGAGFAKAPVGTPRRR